MTKQALSLAVICISMALGACSSIGSSRLRADQVDYARALGDAKKREILADIVGMRYADPPGFMSVTSIIAAYSFDAGSTATLNVGPGTSSYERAVGVADVSYSNHPTFTFTPTTGEAYATAYIRPLPATLILPLADSGTPIDLLLRLTVQSIAGLQNDSSLGGPNGNGSPEFFALLRALRNLQIAGELTVAYTEVNHQGQVSMTLSATPSGESIGTNQDLMEVRKLLHLTGKTKTYQIVYGQGASGGNEIPMVTRSVLGILSNLGAQISVPAADITSGATKPTVSLVGGETRPTIVVRNGSAAPRGAYVAVGYHGQSYWVDQTDFDSKYALSIVQNLMALAQANINVAAPIVTVPAS